MGVLNIDLPSKIGKGYASFWKSKHRYRILKGGRGSKKSTTTAMWFIYNIMKYPLSNAVVVRKTYATHLDSTFAQLKWAAQRLGVYDKWTFKLSPLECIYNPTGQKIMFRGFDDPLKLTSITVEKGVLCWAWLEEAYEIESADDFDTFDESIRGEMPKGYFKQVTMTFNPWVNTHWTKDRYFDNEYPNAFTLTTTYRCNEWLDDADRKKIEDLAITNPDRYKVVGLGDYGIPGGVYFDEFRSDIHVVQPFVIPSHWKRYTTTDYGLDMLATYWLAVDPQGYAYVYKELYESNLIISDAAKKILETNGNDVVSIKYAPPDLWNRRQETGRSAAEIFSQNGVTFIKSKNNRIQGWYNVKEWLSHIKKKDVQTGEVIITSKLKIFSNCVNLIRTLPQIQRDEHDPNDVADQPHELTHGPDAIRYFCSMRPSPNDEVKQNHYNWDFEKPSKPYYSDEADNSYINY